MPRLCVIVAALWSCGSLAEAPASAPPPYAAIGTTVVGERDTALGLSIAPWKEEYAGDMDRPPALLDEPLAPIDARSFQEQVATYETVAAYRRARYGGHH